MDIQGKIIPGTESCLCTGPDARVYLVSSKKSKEESIATAEKVRGRWWEMRSGKLARSNHNT